MEAAAAAATAAATAAASASTSDAAMLTTTTTVTASSTSSGGVANATTAAATSASSTTFASTPSSSSPVMLRRKLPKAPVFVRRGPIARGHRALAAQNAQQQAQQLQVDGAHQHQHLHAACTSPVSSERDLGGLQKRFEDEDDYHFSRLVASEKRGRARAARARRRLHELDDALTNNEFERHARRHRDDEEDEEEEEEEDYYESNDHTLRVDLARAFTPVETCVPMRPPVASQFTPTSPAPLHMRQALTHVDTDCEESATDAQQVALENALTTVDTCAADIGNATPPSPAGVWATASVPESSVTASAGADSATGGRDAFDLDIDGAEVVSEEETVDLRVAREAVEKRRSSSSPSAMAIAGVQEKEVIIRGPSSPSRSAVVEDDGDAESGKKKGKSPRRLRRGRKGKRETEVGNVKEGVNEENTTATSAENSPRRRLRARLFRGRRRANGAANTKDKDKETEMKNTNVDNTHSDDSDFESEGERARGAPSLPVNRNDARYSQTYAAARRVSLCDRFRLRRDRKRTQQLALVAPMVAENALYCSDGSGSENEDGEKRNSTAIQNAKEVAVITADRAEKDVVQQHRQDDTPPAMVKGRRVRFACFQPKIKAELVTGSATSFVRNVSLAQDDWIDFATSAAIAQRQKKQWPFARKPVAIESQKAASPVKHRPPPPPILHPAGSHVVRWGGPS